MPDFLVILLYRPLYQQWLLFVLLMLSCLVISAVVWVCPRWQILKSTQPLYQQQSVRLKQQQRLVAESPPLRVLERRLEIIEAQQHRDNAPEILWSAGDSVQVLSWQRVPPRVLKLRLNWKDMVPLFGRLTLLSPSWLAEGFTVTGQSGGLEMTFRRDSGD